MNDKIRPESNEPFISTFDTQNTPQYPVVAMGASAGGLEAIVQLLQTLPADTGMSFVIIQHLHPDYPSSLVEILSRITKMPVHQVSEGAHMKPNEIYIIPPNALMSISDGALHLTKRANTRGPQMPIDYFLRHLAEEYKSQAIGIILSGTGTDGTLGLKALKDEGGISIAQDESAKFDGMPRSAIAAGHVDFVLSPSAISEELVRFSRHPYVYPARTPGSAEEGPPAQDADFATLFALLRKTSGADFTHYKQSTIRRRIQRRMVLNKINDLDQYEEFAQKNPAEAQALYQDILINVTSFFRDNSTFEALKTTVFPALLNERPPNKPLRIWVPGCSTGEEVYSIAICLLECLGDLSNRLPIKIFATDISLAAVDRARNGRYLDNVLSEVSNERLRRFFEPQDDGYQVCKTLREMCIFARHDITQDPPFSNLDLISCRNLLIYLESILQRRVLPMIHYALNDGAFLMLGKSETIGSYGDLFQIADTKNKIYVRKPGSRRIIFDFTRNDRIGFNPVITVTADVSHAPSNLEVQREADRTVLSRYAPAGVVINDNMEVVQFRGKTGQYLEPAIGQPSMNILKMAREGLLLDLRALLDSARKENCSIRKEGIVVKTNDHYQETTVEIIPLTVPPTRERFFLVLFTNTIPAKHADQTSHEPKTQQLRSADQTSESEMQVLQLQRELAAVRDYLQSIIEQQEAGNEELKAANEEVVSSNEELQSTNEELQTAKEEVQAANEELTTTNDELQRRHAEAQLLSDDLTNLLRSVQIPIVMLGRDLQVRRFTPGAGKIFNLIPSDVGRPIGDIKSHIHIKNLEEKILEVIEAFSIEEREIQDDRGHWYWMSIRPYRTTENKIDGAVLSFVDLTEQKKTAEALRQSEAMLRKMTDTIPGAVFEYRLAPDGTESCPFVSPGISSLLGIPLQDTPTKLDFLWSMVPWYRDRIRAALQHSKEMLSPFNEEYCIKTPQGQLKWLFVSGTPQRNEDESTSWYSVVMDITERKEVENALRQSEARLQKQAESIREQVEQRTAELRLSQERLQRSERLASIGTLAAGIAHELNNPVGGILLSAEAALIPPTSSEKARNTFEKIIQYAERSKEIIDNIRKFASAQPIPKEIRDVAAVIHRAVSQVMLEYEKRGCGLTVSIEKEPLMVAINETAIEQAAVNLLHNALQSSATHVIITVDTSEKDTRIRIKDDGCGIPEETLGNLFDPFFTTRRSQGGTGLGLSIVHRIIQDHAGTIDVVSSVGKGATFTIHLPINDPSREKEMEHGQGTDH